MKKYLLLLTFVYSLFSSPFLVANSDEIVSTGNAVQFGLWKVYNAGAFIYFIDEDAKHIVKIEFSTNPPGFYSEKNRIFISTIGSSVLHDRYIDPTTQKEVDAALASEVKNQLRDGLYRFGQKQYFVKGDTITIFNNGYNGPESSDSVASIATVLKKFSNGMVFNGSDASAIVDPTVMLDANSTSVPAKNLGDCLATYSVKTGRVEIPCLSIIGDTTVYSVGQQQISGSLNFEVKENDISTVQ